MLYRTDHCLLVDSEFRTYRTYVQATDFAKARYLGRVRLCEMPELSGRQVEYCAGFTIRTPGANPSQHISRLE